ncbi:MAG TPA: hypothetical protein VLZ28_01225 [Daejeonella sp.]|nr:hypothetical protein [Daejeonella sp.]
MSADQNNQNQNRTQNNTEGTEADSQSQNNNGNIGREVDDEKEGHGSFTNLSKDIANEKPVNEEGIGENRENHWVGNHGQQSSNRPGSANQDDYSDQNLTDGGQQNRSRNHVTNAGGTSQEDLEKGNTGLTDEEND